jgi:hypothetical protein
MLSTHVLAGDVLELPGVAPVRRVAVLQPEDRRGRVRRHVLDIRRVDRLLRAGRHEDLDGVVVVAAARNSAARGGTSNVRIYIAPSVGAMTTSESADPTGVNMDRVAR